mmetsp:Transcript_22489/g.66976  ORF Transcript_22489/g.66976 Transcript_22489/m.66976 type:complete len:285 (+) Transcript_22489:753-1607(+)
MLAIFAQHPRWELHSGLHIVTAGAAAGGIAPAAPAAIGLAAASEVDLHHSVLPVVGRARGVGQASVHHAAATWAATAHATRTAAAAVAILKQLLLLHRPVAQRAVERRDAVPQRRHHLCQVLELRVHAGEPRANRGAPLAPCHVVARLSARKHRPQHRVAHVAVHLAVGPHQPAGLERVVLLAAPVRGAPVLRQHLLAVKLVLQHTPHVVQPQLHHIKQPREVHSIVRDCVRPQQRLLFGCNVLGVALCLCVCCKHTADGVLPRRDASLSPVLAHKKVLPFQVF